MRIITLALVYLCSSILCSGCTTTNIHEQSVKQDAALAEEQVTDNRMSDPAVINHDSELCVGDSGVETIVSLNRIQSFEKENVTKAPLLAPNGYPLIQSFPNKSITPIRGSYVENVIRTAKKYLGTPYLFGSDRTDDSSFDCSDFTRWVYLYSIGVDLPWDSRSQAAYVKAFSKRTYTNYKKARRGDLLFFTRFLGSRPSDYKGLKASEKPITHMGIYLGNGKIIHSASKETGGVRIDKIRWKHLEYRFIFGGGVLD